MFPENAPVNFNLQPNPTGESVAKKSTLLTDKEMSAQLKQTEESLISLAKMLGLVNMSIGSESNRNSVLSQVNTNCANVKNAKNTAQQKPSKTHPHHHQQASSVVRIVDLFIFLLKMGFF